MQHASDQRFIVVTEYCEGEVLLQSDPTWLGLLSFLAECANLHTHSIDLLRKDWPQERGGFRTYNPDNRNNWLWLSHLNSCFRAASLFNTPAVLHSNDELTNYSRNG